MDAELRGISKRFGGVQALRDVSLRIEPGRIHAVLGENGAGKSTLIKILTGVLHPDTGSILLTDTPHRAAGTMAQAGAGGDGPDRASGMDAVGGGSGWAVGTGVQAGASGGGPDRGAALRPQVDAFEDGAGGAAGLTGAVAEGEALSWREVRLHSPRAAREAGITAVPQDVVLVPQLSIGRNVLLGLEGGLARKSVLSAAERGVVETALAQVGADFSAGTPTADLSVPQLRLAQLARALIGTGQVVVLDEPTAALSAADADHLLERLEALRDDGKAIVYVSHRLSEVTRLADVVTVLRNGEVAGRFRRDELDRAKIVEVMTKRTEESLLPNDSRPVRPGGKVLLEVRGLGSDGRFDDVSFTVTEHKIVGIAGVQGSGQGQLLAAIAGQDGYDTGSVQVAGSPVGRGSVARAYRAGMALVPADRRGAGIVGGMSIQRNLALPARSDHRARRFGIRRPAREAKAARGYVRDFGVRCHDVHQPAGTLSGGNQQKISLARALAANPTVLLIDEPTQGVDVGAKAEIRELLRRAAGADRAVVVAASEFEDLIGLADEILVMRAGRIVATLDGHTTTYREILHHALP